MGFMRGHLHSEERRGIGPTVTILASILGATMLSGIVPPRETAPAAPPAVVYEGGQQFSTVGGGTHLAA